MPIISKVIAITCSEAFDKGYCVLLNRGTGDIWHSIIAGTGTVIDLANNNIYGDAPTQWVNGNVLEITVFGSTKKGTETHTVINGINDVSVKMDTDTAVEINL